VTYGKADAIDKSHSMQGTVGWAVVKVFARVWLERFFDWHNCSHGPVSHAAAPSRHQRVGHIYAVWRVALR
jgi:hypothetical protein